MSSSTIARVSTMHLRKNGAPAAVQPGLRGEGQALGGHQDSREASASVAAEMPAGQAQLAGGGWGIRARNSGGGAARMDRAQHARGSCRPGAGGRRGVGM